jgi:hypothetical protein
MGLFDQATSQSNQGLMGLGQQPQQGLNPYATNRGLPMPQNPNYMGQQPNIQEEFGVPFDSNPIGNSTLGQQPNWQQGPAALSGGISQETAQPNFMGQPQGNMPPMQQYGENPFAFNEVPSFQMPTNSDWKSNPEYASLGGDMMTTIYKQPDGTYRDESGKPTDYSQYNQRIDWTQNRFNPTQQPQGNMPQIGRPLGRFNPAATLPDGTRNSEGGSYEYPQPVNETGFNQGNPQQPPQFFQPQPMQQQNPVNTQTVQPNFMGQTPFGQAQTGQFTSTNPFVQAAQANAQGNIAGALQATAANRINQQTPYGSLSYQQTGTDAQGNPIWSANQQLSPELQQLTQSSLAGLQASQANPMYGINPGDTYSNAIMQRLAPQQSQAREALDAQLANQGIMPGSEAYNRAKTLLGQTQNDALTSAIVGGMQTGLQAQGLQNTTAANIRNLATPGYVTPYNQAAVAGPDYLSAYTSQNATDIARANAEAAQRSSLLSGLAGLGSSAILGGTGPNSALGGLYGLGSKGLESLGNSSLWSSLFGGGAPAITGDKDFLKSIGLDNSFYGSGTGGMLTDPLADLYTQVSTPDDLSYLFNSAFGYDF